MASINHPGATGTKTLSTLDKMILRNSITAGVFSSQGFTMTGAGKLVKLRADFADVGSPNDYDETAVSNAFGQPALAKLNSQELVCDFNKAKTIRFQRTLQDDTPISQLAREYSVEYVDAYFIPLEDRYVIAKLVATAKTNGATHNIATTASPVKDFHKAIRVIRENGDDKKESIVSFMDLEFADAIRETINFTGSDAGYTEGKKGVLGKFSGVQIIGAPASYLDSATTKRVRAVFVDKRAVVKIDQKIDPKRDIVIIEKVPGFSGSEVQIRSRGMTAILANKEKFVSIITNAA